MSILNDRQIRELCLVPKGLYDKEDGTTAITSMSVEEVLDARRQAREKGSNEIYFNYREIKHPGLLDNWKPMISEYCPQQVRVEEGKKILSYGQSSAGYDVRLDNKFKIFTNINNVIVDPLDFDHNSCVDFEGDVCIIPPNSYILGITKEVFNIPEDILVLCVGKSTYARAGAIINVTPIEPGFSGKVVIEISNATSLPLKIYAGQGIAQFLFFKANEPCTVPYDSSRKYQGQMEIVTPKV